MSAAWREVGRAFQSALGEAVTLAREWVGCNLLIRAALWIMPEEARQVFAVRVIEAAREMGRRIKR